MKKKFASLFLVMALVLTMIPASAFATTGVTEFNHTTSGAVAGFANSYGVTLSTDKAAYELGDDIHVKVELDETQDLSAITAEGWIGIYDTADVTVNADLSTNPGSICWAYTNGGANGVGEIDDIVIYGPNRDSSVTKNSDITEAGTYYVICVGTDGRYAVLDITIGEEEPVDPNLPTEASMTVNGTTFDREGEIIVTTNYATTDKDWVAVYPKGYSPSNGPSLAWYYVKDKAVNVNIADKANVEDPHCLGYSAEDGRLRPGEYTIYLLENDGRDVITSVDITVTGDDVTVPDGYSMTLVPDELLTTPNANIGDKYLHLVDEGFGNGLNIKVTAPEGADTSSMWVGIYDEGLPSISSFTFTNVGTMAGTTEENAVLFDVSADWDKDNKIGGKRKLVLYTDADSYIAVATVYFFVRPYLGENTIEFDNAELVYTGEHQTPVIKNNKIAGKDARHWTATFPKESIEPGNYTVDAVFHGEVGGSATGTYKIVAKDVADADVKVTGITDTNETGKEIKPTPVVTYNNMTLNAGTDYTVTYKNNTKVGTATVVIEGRGNYTGKKEVTFKINCVHEWNPATCQAPKTCKKGCGATEGSKIGHDQKTVLPAVAATCTAAGKTEGKACSMCGAVQVAQKEVAKLSHDFKVVSVTEATCEKGGQKVEKCANCPEQRVTATAKKAHNYVAVAGKPATCTETGLTAGEKCEACGTWKVVQGVVEKLPHTVAASTVTKKATAKADGVITNTCACGEVVSTDVIAKPVVTLSKAGVAYTGKKVKAPVVRVKAGGKTVATANYTITKPKNVTNMKDIGRYVYTVKFKGDMYYGSVKVNFEIKPAKTKIKAPAAAKKAITVKWTKAAKKEKVTGYEVMYATNNKFTKGKKTVTVKGASKVSKKVTKLKSKTKYFVKVRSYKTVKGVKIYSDWSAVKSIKAK